MMLSWLSLVAVLVSQAPAGKNAPPPSARAPKIYRYDPPPIPVEGVSENLVVEQISRDELKVTVLPGGKEVRDRFIFPLGSHNIRLRVNPDVGSTYFGDLRFLDSCVAALRTTGAVETNSPGIRAEDVEGNRYVSKRVVVANRPIYVMAEDETFPRKPEAGIAVIGFLVDRKGEPSVRRRVCIVTPTEDGRMAFPFSLADGRLREASAISDAKGRFVILTDPFPQMYLALCAWRGAPPTLSKYEKSLAPIQAPPGRWMVEMGKVVVE
jgi:hypothetical protein